MDVGVAAVARAAASRVCSPAAARSDAADVARAAPSFVPSLWNFPHGHGLFRHE
jgi:hypothetical protein